MLDVLWISAGNIICLSTCIHFSLFFVFGPIVLTGHIVLSFFAVELKFFPFWVWYYLSPNDVLIGWIMYTCIIGLFASRFMHSVWCSEVRLYSLIVALVNWCCITVMVCVDCKQFSHMGLQQWISNKLHPKEKGGMTNY